MGTAYEVLDRRPVDAEPFRIWPARPEGQPQRLGLDGEQSGIERPVMGGAKDETIPRVVRPLLLLGPEMGRIEQIQDIDNADGATWPIPPQDPELVSLLADSNQCFTPLSRPPIDKLEGFLLVIVRDDDFGRLLAEDDQKVEEASSQPSTQPSRTSRSARWGVG